MADVSIRLAETPADFEAARTLSRDWLDWHWRHYPSDWSKGPDHPMDPVRFESIVQDLPQIHARPRGGILLGSVKGQDMGCVMYAEAEPETAVFNRMFVRDGGRGHGLGRRLLDGMFEQMIADGYRRVIFSSANFLTHAKAMYQAAGFRDMPQPDGFPDELRERVYFMERALA